MNQSLGSAAPDALTEVSSRVPGWWMNQTNALRCLCIPCQQKDLSAFSLVCLSARHQAHPKPPSFTRKPGKPWQNSSKFLLRCYPLLKRRRRSGVILLIHHFTRLSVNELPRRLTWANWCAMAIRYKTFRSKIGCLLFNKYKAAWCTELFWDNQ